ncbi:MAG: 16S rRNA (cytosine(967)-C(5))-methyltransferase RsmB [Turicibacter sp.]|nr:16S rRNA (cytosine(967)-C(5))-methyltransferase RsmB [Turicibacter sp.]
MANVREAALTALSDIITNNSYSNRTISELIEKNKLGRHDRALFTEIVYGTLEHFQLLDFYVQPYFKSKVKSWMKLLVYMTLYQILYLNSIPEHAAISEAVNIAKKRGGQFNGGLVNGILRELRRNPLRDLEEIEDVPTRMATEYSHPLWLVKLWNSQYGEAATEAILKANGEKVPLTLRVNTSKTNRKTLKKNLLAAKVETVASPLNEEALIVTKGNPMRTRSFEAGEFYVQDEASMLVAKALDPKSGSRVLDTCSAPGGKALHAAALMNGSGEVVANDLYPHKIKLIEDNAARLGVENVKATLKDAALLHEAYQKESFDYLMVDAPCSALGILRRHPEAKITKRPEDLDGVGAISYQILDGAASLLKPGGRLVFSTCTINRKENDKQVERFLREHPEFSLDGTLPERLPEPLREAAKDGMIQLFPGMYGTDGFFIASLMKKV